MSNITKLDRTLQAIVVKLHALSLPGKIIGLRVGPTVSIAMYQPDATVRVAAVQRAAADLSLVARGQVRVFPVPAENAVGIEYPNAQRALINFEQVACSPEAQAATQPLAIPLGVDAYGVPVVVNLADCPHLLVAGATGSGKSNALHAIIISLMLRNACDKLQFIMIDPKGGVELGRYRNGLNGGQYRGIPHIAGFATTRDEALQLLQRAVLEVERRYQLMAQSGARSATALGLPALVIVIDELADLMAQGRRALEEVIAQLAAKARAANVHLVVATQRPSVNVITGVIKANLPARLAFHLPSQHDSRTVLDVGGAEKLLDKGDSLFNGAGLNLARIQCAYVSDAIVAEAVAGAQYPPAPIPPASWGTRLGRWFRARRALVPANRQGQCL